MPVIGPLLMVALVIVTITGVGAATFHLTQERSDKLYREIDADIQETLRQHQLRKIEFATLEQPAPPVTTAPAANRNDDRAGDAKVRDDKARKKAQVSSIRKRATGDRRERLVPPDFARLPAAVARGVFGFTR
jgi:hypothetical protein